MRVLSPQPRFRIYSRLNDYFAAFPSLVTGGYAVGHWREALQERIQSDLNVPYALCMPQARVGVHLAVASVARPGAEVILSPNTIADVVNMVITAGAKPVFCDIDEKTGNIDPELVEALITPNTVAILATHLYGLVAPMARLRDIAGRHNLCLMEDAAQSFGARQGGKLAGSIGDVGIFSFGMAKNVMAFFGGMLVTHDRKVFEHASKQLASFPIESKAKLSKKVVACFVKDLCTTSLLFPHILFPLFRHGYRNNIKKITRYIETELDLSLKTEFPTAYKTQMSPLQAGIILGKLGKVDQHYKHRLECARIYNRGLADIPELTIPPFLEDGSHVYNYYTICYERREELRLYMMNHGRDAALQHIKNTADLPSFKEFYRDCPKARTWAQSAIMLPNYIRYSLKEVERNVEVLRKYFGR